MVPTVSSPTVSVSGQLAGTPASAPATAVLDLPSWIAESPRRTRRAARDPESLFAPVVAPTGPYTPGLGHAFGPGRRIPRTDDRAARAEPGTGNQGERWWQSPTYVELQRAVDAVFEDVADAPTPPVELIRPYIEHSDSESVWAGVGVVPPPTPVAGIADPSRSLSGSLPTRRQLREQRRAEQSARTAARNRLAKGGVLAVAMFGAVATQAPQALHDRLFGGSTTTTTLDPAAAALDLTAPGRPVDTSALPRDGVEQTLREQLLKEHQVQRVSEAAQSAGGVLVAVAKAQAATDQAARQAALARATREAQRNPTALARIMVAERGWSSGQYSCLVSLWKKESNWKYRASNPSSGAYGIPQSLPGSKMASAGSDWRTNPATQIEWGLGYIADRYGTPCAAWAHSGRVNWY